jgi:hypothetical protein
MEAPFAGKWWCGAFILTPEQPFSFGWLSGVATQDHASRYAAHTHTIDFRAVLMKRSHRMKGDVKKTVICNSKN